MNRMEYEKVMNDSNSINEMPVQRVLGEFQLVNCYTSLLSILFPIQYNSFHLSFS